MRVLASAVLSLSLLLAACGEPTTTVRGQVTDGTGTQRQALQAPGAPSFGGEGTVSAATTVRAYTVSEGGTITVLATADISADGSYELQLPPETERVVISTEGETHASVLVDRAGEAGGERFAAPMSSESSLEAEVFIQMAASGMKPDEVDTVALRALIDEAMAAEVKARHDAGEDVTKVLAAIGDAVRVAQESRLQAWARAGVNVTARVLFEAQLEASAKLDAALDAGEAAAAAYERFFAELDAARERLGAKAKERADGERAASAGFRGTLQARLGVDVDSAALGSAAIRSASAQESRAAEAAAMAAVSTAAQADDAKARVTAAFAAFRTALRENASLSATAAAYAQLSADLATDSSIEATALGAQLGVTAATRTSASMSVQAVTQAGATLEATLDAAFGALSAVDSVQFTALAQEVVDAYGVYSDAVTAQATALAVFGPQAQGGVELLLVAEGSYGGQG